MKNQTNNNFIKNRIENFKKESKFLNLSSNRVIGSLKSISQVIFVFTLLFLGAFLFKLFTTDLNSLKQLTLPIVKVNILPLISEHHQAFIIMCIYETLRFIVLAFVFYFFIKFLNSLNVEDPFKNIKSSDYISVVAKLSLLFFTIDAIGMMHLAYFEKSLGLNEHLNLFNFEYLVLTYFVYTFAIVFKKGVELNHEIELVI